MGLFIIDGSKISKDLDEEINLWIKEMSEKKIFYEIIFIPISEGVKKLGLNGKYYIKDNDFDKIKATYKRGIRLPKNTLQKIDLLETVNMIVDNIINEFLKRVKDYEVEIEKLNFNKVLNNLIEGMYNK
jgi:hypothetical protein